MVEKLADGSPAQVVRKRAPGLNKVAETPDFAGCRGFLAVGGITLVAMEDRQLAVQQAGDGTYTMTSLGALDGTEPVTYAKNNKFPTPDLVCVSENGAFQVFTGSAPISYPDPDVGSPNSVCFGDGYFFFTYGDGTCIASDLNSTAINAVNFTTAESKPDTLLRGVFFRQELFLMGTGSIEVWQNTANATGFPFSRSTVIARGLMGRQAVAGWEDGWANALLWVGDDAVVYEMKGYVPTRISTHDVERAIEQIALAGNGSVLKAFVYMSEGHAFWALKSDEWCWVYDLTTGTWHERQSYGSATWRAQFSVKNYGLWLVGDETTGAVNKIQADYYYENGNPLVWTVTSGQMVQWPQEVAVPVTKFYFDQNTGMDDGSNPIETNPRVAVSWSNNGGLSWSQPIYREFGAQGEWKLRVQVNRTGKTGPQGRQWKLEVSDPVYVGLLAGDMTTELRG